MLEGIVSMADHRYELYERNEREKGEMKNAEWLDQDWLVVQRRNGYGYIEHVLESVLCQEYREDEGDPERVEHEECKYTAVTHFIKTGLQLVLLSQVNSIDLEIFFYEFFPEIDFLFIQEFQLGKPEDFIFDPVWVLQVIS